MMHAAGEDSWYEQFLNCRIMIKNLKQHSSTKWWPHLKKAEDGKNQNEAIANTQNQEEPHKAAPNVSRGNRHKHIVPVLGCALFVLAINNLYNVGLSSIYNVPFEMQIYKIYFFTFSPTLYLYIII